MMATYRHRFLSKGGVTSFFRVVGDDTLGLVSVATEASDNLELVRVRKGISSRRFSRASF